jgi:Chemoreceptor zinc-binding domain
MDAATISTDNCCDLGKWLYGDAKSQYGHLASYRDCVAKHKTFHIEAGKIAAAINAKRYAEAEAMIAPSSPYFAVSNLTGIAIMHLEKEAGLDAPT